MHEQDHLFYESDSSQDSADSHGTGRVRPSNLDTQTLNTLETTNSPNTMARRSVSPPPAFDRPLRRYWEEKDTCRGCRQTGHSVKPASHSSETVSPSRSCAISATKSTIHSDVPWPMCAGSASTVDTSDRTAQILCFQRESVYTATQRHIPPATA